MPEITPCQLHQVLRDVSVKHHVVIVPEHYFLKVISISSAYVVAGGILLGPIGLVAGGSLAWASVRLFVKRPVFAVTILDSLNAEEKRSLYERFKVAFQTIDNCDQIALEKMIAANKHVRDEFIKTLKTYLATNTRAIKAGKAVADRKDNPAVVTII